MINDANMVRLRQIAWAAAICLQLAAVPGASSQSNAHPASGRVTLYGRIEELSTHSGAQLPVKLTSQQARVDQSRLLRIVPSLSGQVSSQAAAVSSGVGFPEAWEGYWNGTLKVHSNQFAPVSLQVDRDETLKEQELLAPGKEGSVSFTFSRVNSKLYLEPSQVVFSAPLSQSRHADDLRQLSAVLGAPNQGLGAQMAGLLENTPYYYGLMMGNVSQGVGVTGNALHNEVIKNDVKQLAAGIVEQDLVSYNVERNPTNDRVQNGYSEIVLRFYKQSPQQLYVQVASVNYLSDGRFKDKILLYGTVQRANTPITPPPYSVQTIDSSMFSRIPDTRAPYNDSTYGRTRAAPYGSGNSDHSSRTPQNMTPSSLEDSLQEMIKQMTNMTNPQ